MIWCSFSALSFLVFAGAYKTGNVGTYAFSVEGAALTSSQGGLSTGTIVGVVVGTICVVAALVGAVAFVIAKRRKN